MRISSSDHTSLRRQLLKTYWIDRPVRVVIADYLDSPQIRLELIDACAVLNIALLRDVPSELLAGCDAFLSDQGRIHGDILSLIQKGVVPILPRKNSYGKAFSEFLPMQFTGNAFLFSEPHPIVILEQICRYMENSRYPWDRRILLKNLMKTQL